MIDHLRRQPEPKKIEAACAILPSGFVVSSPHREQVIRNMETALDLYLRKVGHRR